MSQTIRRRGRPPRQESSRRERHFAMLAAAETPLDTASKASGVLPLRALKLLSTAGFVERVEGFRVMMLDDQRFNATLIEMRDRALRDAA